MYRRGGGGTGACLAAELSVEVETIDPEKTLTDVEPLAISTEELNEPDWKREETRRLGEVGKGKGDEGCSLCESDEPLDENMETDESEFSVGLLCLIFEGTRKVSSPLSPNCLVSR